MAHEAFSRTAGMVWIASKRSLGRFFWVENEVAGCEQSYFFGDLEGLKKVYTPEN